MVDFRPVLRREAAQRLRIVLIFGQISLMTETPPEHINEMDWRIQNLTWIRKPFKHPATGVIIPEGVPMAPVALIHHGKENLGAVIPNATALFLNLSHTFHAEARTLLKKCIGDKDKFGKLPDDEAFTLYERMMGSAVFACTALEAFVNEQIPDTYTYIDSSDNDLPDPWVRIPPLPIITH